jgi:hypothetical protein
MVFLHFLLFPSLQCYSSELRNLEKIFLGRTAQ